MHLSNSISRMTSGLLFSILLCSSQSLSAACVADPLPQATSGYGSDGAYTQGRLVFTNPVRDTDQVFVYYPEAAGPAPTIFFSHAFGARAEAAYTGTIRHLNSIGYTVVEEELDTHKSGKKNQKKNWTYMDAPTLSNNRFHSIRFNNGIHR